MRVVKENLWASRFPDSELSHLALETSIRDCVLKANMEISRDWRSCRLNDSVRLGGGIYNEVSRRGLK